MESGTLQGLITIAFMASFIALVWMAYRPANKNLYEERGRIPFDGEAETKDSE